MKLLIHDSPKDHGVTFKVDGVLCYDGLIKITFFKLKDALGLSHYLKRRLPIQRALHYSPKRKNWSRVRWCVKTKVPNRTIYIS